EQLRVSPSEGAAAVLQAGGHHRPGRADQPGAGPARDQLMDVGGPRGPLSRHSVHAYIRAVNHFLAWAQREGEPVQAKAQRPPLPKAVLEVLSREGDPGDGGSREDRAG